jgi:uncharacterized 2Fe-2S/4Fe-4S cluster protein (DUF4445 family)
MKKVKKNKKPKKKRQSLGAFPRKKQKGKSLWLHILPEDLWLKVKKGKTLWEVLQKTDVVLEGDCGGVGQCGKCKVRVLSSLPPPSTEEHSHLDPEAFEQGIRLACRTKIKKDLVIRTEESEADEVFFQILKTGHQPEISISPLVENRLVALPSEDPESGNPDLDRIRAALGPEYRNVNASLHCLRTLPEASRKQHSEGVAVLHGNCLIDWQNGTDPNRFFGLVFDLGTSTLVGKLISLRTGAEVAAISRLNSQIRYGTNVISRIQYVMEHSYGLRHLSDLLIKDLRRITRRLLEVEGLHPWEVYVAVMAGNTTMQHFLLGLDPVGIAGAPFAPVLTDGVILKAQEIGLELNPESIVYVMPSKSGYIGGDMIGTILVSGAAEQEDKMVLGLDLGTNGEIFLGNRQKLITCAAAAGPALEGAKISNGLIAKAGAIEGVRSESEGLAYHVIGNIKAKGICGSGLVDLVAVLLHCGIIDSEGLILPPDNGYTDAFQSRIIENHGTSMFLVAPAEECFHHRPIFLTQKDVRELQLAKGAIAAGIQTLMDEMGIGIRDVDEICLAGALGNYVNHFSAMRIGLIPLVESDRIRSLGNAASTGAKMALLSKAYWQKALDLAQSIEYIELSGRTDFNRYFIENMDFPEENIW